MKTSSKTRLTVLIPTVLIIVVLLSTNRINFSHGTIFEESIDPETSNEILTVYAPIEAARAGEQGRGFAVVADEVRTQAQKTQGSIKEIQTTVESLKLSSVNAVKCIESIQVSVAESVTQAGMSIELLDKVADSVAETVQMNNEVKSVSGEQKLAIDSITNSLVIINNSSDTASASADKARQLSSLNSKAIFVGSKARCVDLSPHPNKQVLYYLDPMA